MVFLLIVLYNKSFFLFFFYFPVNPAMLVQKHPHLKDNGRKDIQFYL